MHFITVPISNFSLSCYGVFAVGGVRIFMHGPDA